MSLVQIHPRNQTRRGVRDPGSREASQDGKEVNPRAYGGHHVTTAATFT
jgi:hypothetical protein